MGRVEEARRLLARAIEVSGEYGDELKLQALDDPDLAALWQSVGVLQMRWRMRVGGLRSLHLGPIHNNVFLQ
jgi:hypothetical protein